MSQEPEAADPIESYEDEDVQAEPFRTTALHTQAVAHFDDKRDGHIDLSITLAPKGNVNKGAVADVEPELLYQFGEYIRKLANCKHCVFGASLERGDRKERLHVQAVARVPYDGGDGKEVIRSWINKFNRKIRSEVIKPMAMEGAITVSVSHMTDGHVVSKMLGYVQKDSATGMTHNPAG